MGEIEVGEYVRTKDGKIYQYIRDLDELYFVGKDYFEPYLEDIVNHSKQLMELIEVKDLVCFKNKLQNSLENEEMIIHIFDNDTLEEVKQAIEKGEIELLEILTHEQFEQNSYKVGGEDD